MVELSIVAVTVGSIVAVATAPDIAAPKPPLAAIASVVALSSEDALTVTAPAPKFKSLRYASTTPPIVVVVTDAPIPTPPRLSAAPKPFRFTVRIAWALMPTKPPTVIDWSSAKALVRDVSLITTTSALSAIVPAIVPA